MDNTPDNIEILEHRESNQGVCPICQEEMNGSLIPDHMVEHVRESEQ